MAIEILNRKTRLGVLQQSKASNHCAAPKDETANFITLATNAGVPVPDPNVIRNEINYLAANGVMAEASRSFIDSVSGLKAINFSDYAIKQQIAMHLAAMFQVVSEGVTGVTIDLDDENPECAVTNGEITDLAVGQTIAITGVTFGGNSTTTIQTIGEGVIILTDAPDSTVLDAPVIVLDYPKSFTFYDGNLDFAANSGYLFTLAFHEDITNGGKLLLNSIMDAYSLSINNEGNGTERLLMEEGTYKGNEMLTGKTFSGTWTAFPTTKTFYKDFTLNLTYNGVAYNSVCWKNFKLDFTANVTPICNVNGKAGNYLVTITPECTIEIPYNDTTKEIFNDYIEGDVTCGIEFFNTVTKGKVDGDLWIGFTGELTANPFLNSGEYNRLRLTIKPLRPTAGWGTVLKMSDKIDWGF